MYIGKQNKTKQNTLLQRQTSSFTYLFTLSDEKKSDSSIIFIIVYFPLSIPVLSVSEWIVFDLT